MDRTPTQAPPPRARASGRPDVPWYRTTWFTVLALVLVFPVGLALMWTCRPGWSRTTKWITTAVVAAAVVALGATAPQQRPIASPVTAVATNAPTTSAVTPEPSPTATQPEPTVGSPLPTPSMASALPAVGPTTGTSPPTGTLMIEAVNFAGAVVGSLTVGLDPHPNTDQNPVPALVQNNDGTVTQPAPTWTQCASFKSDAVPDPFGDFTAVISGVVGGTRFSLLIDIREDSTAYTTPGTPVHLGTDNYYGDISLYRVADGKSWVQVYGPSTDPNALGAPPTVTLAADRKSGTIDAWLGSETSVIPQTDALPVVHVAGSWRCG